MATGDFDLYYGDTPVSALDQNQRDWYHPIVDTLFRTASVYTGLVRFYQNLGAVNAKNMIINQILDVHPDFDPLGLRDIWMPASHLDSRQLSITFSRYGGKVAYHEYDDIITFWKQNRAGGMARILQGQLGNHMVSVHDLLTRNAFLNLPFQQYVGGGSDFSAIGTADTMTLGLADEMWLGFGYREVPMAINPMLPQANAGQLLCVTTPGVVYDLRQGTSADEDWLPIIKYVRPELAFRYEVGSLRGTRYIQTPRATLWNCGTLLKQVTISAAVTAGDGSPDPETTQVDGTYNVGQKAATHYIQCDSDLDSDEIAVGDIITIHIDRTNAFGITNGVDYRDGKLHNRRVVALDNVLNRISVDKPIMVDMNTDLGGGVYGYITKGRHVHSSTFIAGPDAIVGGVGRPPVMKAPSPVDDFEQVFRFSWNGYEGFNTFNPNVAEVVYSSGTIKVVGSPVVQ
jgi:hypothetical protein